MTDLIEALVGPVPDARINNLLARRADLMALTEASRKAVLTPAEPGGLSHALRALIAVRASERLGDSRMKDHYYEHFTQCEDFYDLVGLIEPDAVSDDPWLQAILDHADMLTCRPRTATSGDIEKLYAAGVSDADIVRLAELAAFLGYQVRLVAGLRLMEDIR
ncbi:CMD domain-containing protein [Neorhizobium alkalisoli]|uniref:Uncharacterized protein YciW n=1 Tax=Neorhizobium alkalisoli TaxID=528178 RepID=A0A561QPP0_9HYPH|nr:hypothetical protein [Neorhizobium alkalisoli]TWF52353.1 uncharacterized protein YciW [Neorhizobium alkalisoli]